jgi:hypothetical protein
METNEHYKIISSGSTDRVTQIANNMIKDGWIPVGGLTMMGGFMRQAMWKPPLPDVIKIKMEAATNMEPITK